MRSVRIAVSLSLLASFAAQATAQKSNPDARTVIRRLMTTRPELPEGFGPPHPAVRPAVVREGIFSYSPPILESVSPSADRLVGTTAAGDLYVRAAGSEEKRIIARADAPWRWDVDGAAWSADGQFIAVKRIDDHEVPSIPIVDWTAEHETVTRVRYSRAGEPLAVHRVMIVDAKSGRAIPVEHGNSDPYIRIVGWSADGHSLRLLRADRLLEHIDLLRADARSGAVTRILRDSSDTFVVGLPMLDGYEQVLGSLNLAWFLGARGELVWTSERSGTRQLYLYRDDGRLIRPLTTKLPGLVHRIVDVDEKRGRVYFTASADTAHPYRQQLVSVSLDGGEPRTLAEAGNIPDVAFNRNMDSVAVVRLGLPDLFQLDVMGTDGGGAHTTWKADLGSLGATGLAPEFAWSLAADGKTRLQSMLLKPAGFDPNQRYPVVEYIYAGPHERAVPDQLVNPWLWMLQRLANDGFIVVVTDGRGTPGRGKAFQDFAYGRIGQVEIADHATVLRELARERPYMDMARVGILGHSLGGYFALRALLLEPELYKVAHINAPNLDLARFRVWVEPYMGCLPADCPDAYAAGRNSALIAKLSGRVMIDQGTADRDVPFSDAMRLVHELEAAGKDFDLRVYPGAGHLIMRVPGWEARMHEFFRARL